MKLLGSTPRTARSLLRNNRCVALTAQRFHSRKLNARDEEKNPKGFSPVYVHHVSKIALEHMQEKRADWLVEQGLDRGLHINPNGTFMMSFPARKGFDSGRLWYVGEKSYCIGPTLVLLTFLSFQSLQD